MTANRCNGGCRFAARPRQALDALIRRLPTQLARPDYLNAITPNSPSNPLFGPAVK
jgi:hypothetical protein